MKKKLFSCPKCNLHYKDETWAKKCYNWCKIHNSCSLEITKNSVEAENE